MADYLHPDVLDTGLEILNPDTENLYINSSQPTSYAEAIGASKLGTKAGPTVSVPQAGSPDGRQVTVSPITDGVVNASGLAAYWSLTDNSASKLLATGDLAASQQVTQDNTFTLTSFTIRIPAAVA